MEETVLKAELSPAKHSIKVLNGDSKTNLSSNDIVIENGKSSRNSITQEIIEKQKKDEINLFESSESKCFENGNSTVISNTENEVQNGNQSIPSVEKEDTNETENNKTPEKQFSENEKQLQRKNETTPVKTDEKASEKQFSENEKQLQRQNETTPIKVDDKTSLKENLRNSFKTPDKNLLEDSEYNATPKKANNSESKIIDEKTTNGEVKTSQNSDLFSQEDDEGMISTTEQARLLIAASKTPSKSINKTPIKQLTPSGKRSLENSPITPGKFRRVELITLSSPKAKRFKQI